MRTRKAVGTYGFSDLDRVATAAVKGHPGQEAGQVDVAAVRAGEAREVSCFLRGSAEPYPRRLRQGSLFISLRETYWVPFWSFRRHPLLIDIKAEWVRTRAADHREPNVKKGRVGAYGVRMPAFVVVTCAAQPGEGPATVDFVVPKADSLLVSSYLNGSLAQH